MTTWSIGEAAEKCGLSQHTLRWYERIGLLANIERGGDGRRRFSQADLDWLSLLTKLRATGMPVRATMGCRTRMDEEDRVHCELFGSPS